MSDQELIQEPNTEAGTDPANTGSVRKKKRYQDYDVDKIKNRKHSGRRPWFWKVLGISLLLSMVIVAGACMYFVAGDQKKTDYLSGINEANTMDALLEGHKNITITQSYSHLADEIDYTSVRSVTKTKSGDYYSYLKIEQTEEENKEVIKDKCLYRYDGSFSRFYGLIGDDYEKVCVAEIEGSVYQNNGKETIEDESDKGTLINIKASYTVQDGDSYSTTFGFEPGSRIEKTIILDKETRIITSATEECNDEEFYSYRVEYDGEDKMPRFYQAIQKKKKSRKCMVYKDYGTENSSFYTFDVPYDVYFAVLDQEGYKCYVDAECTREFSEYQLQVENPEGTVKLYLKKEKE